MNNRIITALLLTCILSACGDPDYPVFSDAYMDKNWPDSGMGYVSYRVHFGPEHDGCRLVEDSPIVTDQTDLSFNVLDQCRKKASVKKWYVLGGALIGTFRCKVTMPVAGEETEVIGEVAREVYRVTTDMEKHVRGDCRMALLPADNPGPIGVYTEQRSPQYDKEFLASGKAYEYEVE